MAGTSWPALTAGRKAKGSEVEAKFDWIEGDIVPMNAGSQTNNVFDLGTSTAQWRNIRAGTGIFLNNTDIRLYSLLF